MQYTPQAVPPYLGDLRDISNAIGATRAIVVGSALRDADNGVPVTSFSLYLMPPGETCTDRAVEIFLKQSGPGSRQMRGFKNQPRYEVRTGAGHIVNLNFCHQPWMLEADTMAHHVPNGLSAIAMDLFTGEVNATQLYRLDKNEGTITQVFPGADPGNLVALSVQKRFPAYPILHGHNGEIIKPPLVKPDALLPA